MTRLLPFIILLCISVQTKAAPDSLVHHRLSAGLSPFALIDVNDGPALKLRVEYKTPGRMAYAIDVKNYFYLPRNTGWVNKTQISGYSLSPIVKFYFDRDGQPQRNSNRFLSLWYTYKKQAYTHSDSVVANTNHIYKSFRMRQEVNTFCIAYGQTSPLWYGRFLLEWYAGVGIRFISSSSDLSAGERVYDYHDWTVDLTSYPNTAQGKVIYPTLALGLVLSYKL